MAKKKIEYRLEGIWGKTPIAILSLVTGNELKAYVALASYQGNSEVSWPSLEEIAKRSSLSVQATSEAITGLVKKGLVTRKRNYGKSNTYKVLTPTIEPDIDEYQEKADNQINSDNQENSDVDHQEKSGDGYQGKADNIVKEHIKITNEKNREREESLPKIQKQDEDPFDPVPYHLKPKISNDGFTYSEEGANLVIDFFEEYYQREHQKSSGKIKEKKSDASKLYGYLSWPDKIAELTELVLQFEYSWHGHKCLMAKKADSPWKATPEKIIEQWEKLSSSNVPYYIREGFKTENECLSARRKKAEEKKEEAKPNIDWQALKIKEEERVKQVLAILGETQEMVNGTN